jgi:tetratricopeptide (TPR) repeat protein
MFGVFPPNEVYPRAREAVDKALEIDETLAEAQAWDGALSQWYEWDWSAAEKKFKRAIEMNLNHSEELGFYSWYLSCMGRYEEAIALDNRCLEFNPLSPYENMGVGYTYFLAGRYDEAIVWMRKALELDSNYFYAYKQIARCYTAKGLYEEAIAEFDKAEEIYPQLDPEGIADKALIYATSGRRNEAIIALNKLTKLSKQRYVDPLLFGSIHACLDETDKAFEWLDKAFDVRSPFLVLLRTEALNFIFKNINSDPRYKALLKKMNLE